MKKIFKFYWQLTKDLYAKVNECEENFMRKFDEEYTSKLAKNSLIYLAVWWVSAPLLSGLLLLIEDNMSTNIPGAVGIPLVIIALILPLALFVIFYTKKRTPLIQGRKWWYVIQIMFGFMFGGFFISAPIVGMIVITVMLAVAAFYILIALAVLWFVFTMILGGSIGGSKRRRWKLNNGDVVTEEKGILGESYYTGQGGTSYDTDDGGDTFYEK